jgi:hypothetical protein
MKTNRKLMAAALAATVLALSGCWNDNNNNDSTDPVVPPVVVVPAAAVPDSSGLSVASFVSFILGLSTTDEVSEPLQIKDLFSVPVDESSEPAVLT